MNTTQWVTTQTQCFLSLHLGLCSLRLHFLHGALGWVTCHKVMGLHAFNVTQDFLISFCLDSLGYNGPLTLEPAVLGDTFNTKILGDASYLSGKCKVVHQRGKHHAWLYHSELAKGFVEYITF